jgi:hypothetical protein
MTEKEEIRKEIDKLIKARGYGGEILLDCGEDGFIITQERRLLNHLEKDGSLQDFTQKELACEITIRFKTEEEGLAHIQKEDQAMSDFFKKEEEPAEKKESKETEIEKRDKKLLDAIAAGARIVEKGFGKVQYEIGKGNIINTGQRLDYKRIQVLHCVSDLVARNEWYPLVTNDDHIPKNKRFARNKDDGSYIVIIPFTHFKNHIDKKDLKVQEAIEIFSSMYRIGFESAGKDKSIKLNIGGVWKDVIFAGDNICGVLIASEHPTLDDQRSVEKKLRGRPRKSKIKRFEEHQEKGKYLEIGDREEPVFILVFSNSLGRNYIESAKERLGTRLHYLEMYKLDGRAQELYESVCWRGNKIPIHLSIEYISRVVGWTWPVKNRQRLRERKGSCQRLIDILYEKGFIAKPWITGRGGETLWHFFIRKVRGPKINKVLPVPE